MPDAVDSESISELKLSLPKKILFLAINYIPLCHLTLMVLTVACLNQVSFLTRFAIMVGELYLLPPILARFILWVSPIASRKIPWATKDCFVWWTLHSLQVIFTRITIFEEFLRMIPSVYSMWLRLWGAEIGRLVYWAPGTVILDRSFLKIGDDVVFGAGVRLNPHLIQNDGNGSTILYLAPIIIGDKAIIGGYSLLTPGCEIAAGESTKGFLILPPFSTCQNGKRIKQTDPTATFSDQDE